MSTPQPNPLTDLVTYVYLNDTSGVHVALTRSGSILVWGEGAEADSFAAHAPYGPGYSNVLIYWSSTSSSYIGFALDSNGLIVSWGETASYEAYSNPQNIIYRPPLWSTLYFVTDAPMHHEFTHIYKAGWHELYNAGNVKLDVMMATTKYGDTYIWYDAVVGYNPPSYNTVPLVGWHRSSDIAQFTSDTTLVYNHDPSLDGELFPLSGFATLNNTSTVARTVSSKLEHSARLWAIPKIGETGLRASHTATLNVHSYTEVLGRCFFFAKAVLEADNGLKARLFAGSYAVNAKASLGATDTNLSGQSWLMVEAVTQRCIARNWDLMQQIQDELEASRHC